MSNILYSKTGDLEGSIRYTQRGAICRGDTYYMQTTGRIIIFFCCVSLETKGMSMCVLDFKQEYKILERSARYNWNLSTQL